MDTINFALHSQNNQQIGFLLMSSDNIEPQSGICLFRAMVSDEGLINSLEYKKTEHLQNLGELLWQFDGQHTLILDQNNQPLAKIQAQHLIIEGITMQLIDLAGMI
ncbi:hypothetical protein [Neisseria sp. Ec49-e6-T10]|uniref:hypothetical protein n=1 Tax=Neisseria sp. Ec49-e6-T10 TaxID=3140744 RepID=UPI003EBE74C9